MFNPKSFQDKFNRFAKLQTFRNDIKHFENTGKWVISTVQLSTCFFLQQ
jgi:hypothetical protein